MPVELYIKQLETYNDYLNSYAKRQFAMSQRDECESNMNHTTFMSESSENEKLVYCQRK